ncbi:hypothetical protein ACLOJK_024750 [Asimina triloba]
MSPASRSKSKEKSAARAAAKEQQKASSKPSSATPNTGSGIPASAYNPVSGTFHTLETSTTVSSPPPQNNGRFRNIDETDEHSGSSLGTGAEYDSVSNNDSCSGESEDHKEKAASIAPRPEAIPGCDNDKRDKIRQKNERKHQRQKEKRAQELHERCSGYLMSRKLEALAQQLVAMGFSAERSTMALILNDGRVEDSITWLLEGGEESEQPDPSLHSGGNLKIDITEELARITDMEREFKCTKQEVERAIVASEGDMDKAAETLKSHKSEPASALPKLDEMPDPPAVHGVKTAIASSQIPMRTQMKVVTSIAPQQRTDEKDFNYTKSVAAAAASPDSGNRSFHSLRRVQGKLEWVRPQVAAAVEKRWPSVSASPSVSYSLTSPLQVSPPPSKAEARYPVVGGVEGKSVHAGVVKEPVIMMQRPQTLSAKQNTTASIGVSSPSTAGWYSNSGAAAVAAAGSEVMKGSGGLGPISSMGMSTNNRSTQQFYHQQQYQQFTSTSLDPASSGWGGGSWSMGGSTSSSSLTEPSSLGLFTGWGSAGSSSGSASPVDWSMGGSSMQQCDYASIDWSVESNQPRDSGLLLGLAYVKGNRMYDGRSAAMGGGGVKSTRPLGMNGMYAGLREGGVVSDVSSSSPSNSSHEWTSPFAGQDLFSIPRQFVTSPSL